MGGWTDGWTVNGWIDVQSLDRWANGCVGWVSWWMDKCMSARHSSVAVSWSVEENGWMGWWM